MLYCELSHGQPSSEAYSGGSWNALPDPDTTPPKSEVGLTALFTEIRSTVDTEAQIVKAVFPNPPVVMQVFLQRVFAQSVRPTLSFKFTR